MLITCVGIRYAYKSAKLLYCISRIGWVQDIEFLTGMGDTKLKSYNLFKRLKKKISNVFILSNQAGCCVIMIFLGSST